MGAGEYLAIGAAYPSTTGSTSSSPGPGCGSGKVVSAALSGRPGIRVMARRPRVSPLSSVAGVTQAATRRTRLDPDVFRLPVDRIRSGWYSDQYFNLTKQLLEKEGRHPRVTMQVFQRRQSVIGGIDEAVAIVKLCSGREGPGGWESGWDELDVRALYEGDEISPWETVMTIEGDYSLFAHLETVYLGSLARRSLVMRNVRDVVDAAHGKPILYFPARHDHWQVQTGDGWAAHVAGAIGVSTDAQASWWGGRGVGTVPHSLIAAYGGDTVAAAAAFADRYAGEMNVTVLVDFDNDSVPRLWGRGRSRGPSLGREARHLRSARGSRSLERDG